MKGSPDGRLRRAERRRRDRLPGLLVTLEPLPSEGVPGRGRRRRGEVRVAAHDAVNCALGFPCVRFVGGNVTSRNVLAVLMHEELHHVLGRIGEDRANDALDDMIGTVEESAQLFGGRMGVHRID